jgi:hypothetical protein
VLGLRLVVLQQELLLLAVLLLVLWQLAEFLQALLLPLQQLEL